MQGISITLCDVVSFNESRNFYRTRLTRLRQDLSYWWVHCAGWRRHSMNALFPVRSVELFYLQLQKVMVAPLEIGLMRHCPGLLYGRDLSPLNKITF